MPGRRKRNAADLRVRIKIKGAVCLTEINQNGRMERRYAQRHDSLYKGNAKRKITSGTAVLCV